MKGSLKKQSELLKVIENDYCVGCGMCAAKDPNQIKMYLNEYGQYKPKVKNFSGISEIEKICPFTNDKVDEDVIAGELFRETENIKHTDETGFYIDTFVGYTLDEEERLAATSGGLISWLAQYLLKNDLIDYIVCVGPSSEEGKHFEYQIVNSIEALAKCKKSKYYPVEVSSVIPKIRELEGRFLFIGLPCFIKALRKFTRLDPSLNEKIHYTIGLICGHLKTAKYARYLAHHCGVSNESIVNVDFRHKVKGNAAINYAFKVDYMKNDTLKSEQILMKNVWGSSWGNNLFMLKACEYCDDVFSETADITIGDAWLKDYSLDYRGHSLVLNRSNSFKEFLEAGISRNEIHLDKITIDEAIESQSAGLRQRRNGLNARLQMHENNQWAPKKRKFATQYNYSFIYKIVQFLRIELCKKSKETFLSQELNGKGLGYFKQKLWVYPFILWAINFPKRLKRKLMNIFKL